MDDEVVEIVKKIFSLFVYGKLSLRALAYAKYESGFLDISTKILIKLSELHKTSTDYILGLTNEKSPYPEM